MSTNKYSIRKVAVLGAGVMGSQIAAHCVNAGLEVILLDLKSDEANRPNKYIEESLQKITKMKPAPFALPEYAKRIKIGNFEDDLELLRDVDWICEVIIEKMEVKQEMMAKVDAVRNKTAIISSNTSGLPISQISGDRSKGFKSHFLGTHFFNPPRYMKLLEVIPTESTSEEVLDYMQHFCERILGKGVVLCNDTPNFIANRIGIFSMANIMPYFFNGEFRAEEIDLLLGTLTGYSKAATFRTADMAGLDVTAHVAKNIYPSIPDDEKKETFKLPSPFEEMVTSGHIGNKAGKGFYKRERTKKGPEYLVINPRSLKYESQKEMTDPIIQEAKKIPDTSERLKFLTFLNGETGEFIWKVQRDLLLYAANRIPEITEMPLSVDRAMKWGFNWELGPFERWDALGIKEVVQRLKSEGLEIPRLIDRMLQSGYTSFYKDDEVYDPSTGFYIPIPPAAEGEITIRHLKNEKLPILGNKSAALHDLGDGVALFVFKTKNATLGFELVQTLKDSLQEVAQNYDALVISHDGENFAFGANLREAIEAAASGEWDKIVDAVENFQQTTVSLRYAPFPVISAPFGKTLGGGVEFCLYSDKVVAHHELYAGLVELGVGLIPAGGGTTEMLRRSMEPVKGDADPIPYLREVFKTIGMASVSDSAVKAREMGFLRNSDTIIMNRNLLIKTAKEEALNMLQSGYQPPAKTPIKVQGRSGLAVLKVMLYITHKSGMITDYDLVVGEKVASVLTGGDLSEAQEIPEEYLLKLEKEAILDCFKDSRTIDRLEHMMKTGKALRN